MEELLPLEAKAIPVFEGETAEYKRFFHFGTSPFDMKEYAILITKVNDGIEGFKGLMGSFFFVRGSETANIVGNVSYVSAFKAYNGSILFNNSMGGNSIIKEVKKVTYNNESYYALICNSTLKHDVYFTGIMKDVLFQYVSLAEINIGDI